MAADLNSLVLVGRLTREGELAYTGGGTPVLKMRLAFSTREKDPTSGEWGDRSNFIDVVMYGKRAEGLHEHMTKGKRLGIQGNLRWDEYTRSDGVKVQTYEIIARDLQLVDTRRDGAPQREHSDAVAESFGGGGESFEGGGEDFAPSVGDDDIPF